MRQYFKGWERADSIVVNPHKWLFTPFDLSVLYCSDLESLKQAFSLVPEYLKTSDDAAVKNGMDYGIQLGRRFRALKLWFVIRYFGLEGLHAPPARTLPPRAAFCVVGRGKPRLGDDGAGAVRTRLLPGVPAWCRTISNALNERMMNDVNASGEAYLSHTKLNGKFTLRLSVGSIRVEERHIGKVWELLNVELGKLHS